MTQETYEKCDGAVAYFHLPGLFEFYGLYSLFLPLFYNHREYFYDWCEIGSIYGAPADCLWGGGRVWGSVMMRLKRCFSLHRSTAFPQG